MVITGDKFGLTVALKLPGNDRDAMPMSHITIVVANKDKGVYSKCSKIARPYYSILALSVSANCYFNSLSPKRLF